MNPLRSLTSSPLSLRPSPLHTAPPFSNSINRPLDKILAACAPLPSQALFVGIADDGLPVLFNLRSASPTPVLVAADAGAGKTRLLQTIARAAEFNNDPKDLQYAVLTEHPAEWAGLEHAPHCQAILLFHHALTTGYLNSAASAADLAPSAQLVLFIDGFEALASDADLRHATEILLESTPVNVWPFVTLNTSIAQAAIPLLEAFKILLFGYMRDLKGVRGLAGRSDTSGIHELQPPSQFAVRQAESWLSFWLPEVD